MTAVQLKRLSGPSYNELLAGAIVIALGGGALFALLIPPKVELVPVESGWNDYALTLKSIPESLTTPVTPTAPGQSQPWQLPIPLPVPQLPQIDLGQIRLPAPAQTQLEWVVQAEPCETHELGNHWSGATGMNHCLVRREEEDVNPSNSVEGWSSDPAYSSSPRWGRLWRTASKVRRATRRR